MIDELLDYRKRERTPGASTAMSENVRKMIMARIVGYRFQLDGETYVLALKNFLRSQPKLMRYEEVLEKFDPEDPLVMLEDTDVIYLRLNNLLQHDWQGMV